MRLRRLCLWALLLIPAGVVAQVATYESLTIASTAVGLSSSMLTSNGQQMNNCAGTLEAGQVRYRYDGTSPTSSEGLLLNVGDGITIATPYLSSIKFIRTGSTSGVLKISCRP